MDKNKAISFKEAVYANSYPGRGIIVGNTPDGDSAVIAYFIMGRSPNSRNRVFVWENDELFTRPFDESKVDNPSLIIYTAIRRQGDHIIVSNGDQTDTICEGLRNGASFYESLEKRTFEPDAPNYTPRISADLRTERAASSGNSVEGYESQFAYSMSILKSKDADGTECIRCGWDYESEAGIGHFIHTYEHDGNPLPSFEGEPVCIQVSDAIDSFASEIWEALDEDNRISLFVQFIDVKSGISKFRLINKYSAK